MILKKISRQQKVMQTYSLGKEFIHSLPLVFSEVHADISCRFDWDTSIFPFGFRTHAHSLGKFICTVYIKIHHECEAAIESVIARVGFFFLTYQRIRDRVIPM